MKVFISHAFGGDDERFGNTLKKDLAAAGMDGYMAEKTPRYNLLIADKIRRAISESNWLVAILTKRGQASASVHEEIGYALGRDVEVALMLKTDIKENGVLVHGREPLLFTPGEFAKRSLEMVEFIRNTPLQQLPKPGRPGQDLKQFLDERMLLSEVSHRFAMNKHYGRIHAGAFTGAEKPVVLFTACPRDLGRYCDVMSAGFKEWAKSVDHFDVEGHRIPVRGLDSELDIGSLTVVERHPNVSSDQDIRSYCEFQDNGFFECGGSHPPIVRNLRGEPSLHLCLLIGSFWGFLLHTRLFYQKIGMEGPLTILLSVRDIFKLALGNYGDEVACPEWSYAKSSSLSVPEPHTGRQHIRLLHTFDSVHEMTDHAIAGAARDAAYKICNAYGKGSPKCYSSDGRFSWKLWETMSN